MTAEIGTSKASDQHATLNFSMVPTLSAAMNSSDIVYFESFEVYQSLG